MRPSNVPDEQSLVPYEASAFVGKRVVVFAPHPDDEVLGCGGALADLLHRGARLDAVLLTDGAAGGRRAAKRGGPRAALLARGARLDVVLVTDGAAGARDAEERGRIAATRMEESRRALDALGGGTVHAGGLLDRGLRDRLEEVEALLARWLVEAEPGLVFAPSPAATPPAPPPRAVAGLRGGGASSARQ